MARPYKDGIDYFPFDVGFLQDKKIRLIKGEFGAKGVMVAVQLLCSIYKESGYFTTCDDDDCLLMAEAVGCGVDSEFIRQVICGCVRRSLFDDKLFNVFGILTSRGIQRRFLRAVGTRDNIDIIEEYWLLDVNNKKDVPASILKKITFKNVSLKETPVNLQNNEVNLQINPLKKRKGKKRKEKGGSGGSDVLSVFERCGFQITEHAEERLSEFISEYSAEWVSGALKRAADRDIKRLDYVEGILKKWKARGEMDDSRTEQRCDERSPVYKLYEPDESDRETSAMPEELREKLKGVF